MSTVVARPPTPLDASEDPASGPALAPPPAMSSLVQALSDASVTLFRYGNRYAMVPFHRAGLAAWLGTPLTGWQCLVTTTGRRSGLPRHTPLGYMVADGAVWVMAGYGPKTLWFRNLLDEPRTTLLLPGRPPIATIASEERDPSVRARILPPLVRSMKLPGSLIGSYPPATSDERILELVAWIPLVRLEAADGAPIPAGPDDPGGLGWTWRQALAVGAMLLGCRALWRAIRR